MKEDLGLTVIIQGGMSDSYDLKIPKFRHQHETIPWAYVPQMIKFYLM